MNKISIKYIPMSVHLGFRLCKSFLAITSKVSLAEYFKALSYSAYKNRFWNFLKLFRSLTTFMLTFFFCYLKYLMTTK